MARRQIIDPTRTPLFGMVLQLRGRWQWEEILAMQLDNETRGDFAAAVLIEKIVRDTYGGKPSNQIQPLQWSILRYLARTPEHRRTMSWIRDYMGLTHAPVVRAINTLVKRGLVAQRPNPEDARSSILDLTEEGNEALSGDPIFLMVNGMRSLSKEELDQFKKAVQTIAMNLANLPG